MVRPNPRRICAAGKAFGRGRDRTPCCACALVDGKVEMPKRPIGHRGWGILRLLPCIGAFALGFSRLAMASASLRTFSAAIWTA